MYFEEVNPGQAGFPMGFPGAGRGDPLVRLNPVWVYESPLQDPASYQHCFVFPSIKASIAGGMATHNEKIYLIFLNPGYVDFGSEDVAGAAALRSSAKPRLIVRRRCIDLIPPRDERLVKKEAGRKLGGSWEGAGKGKEEEYYSITICI